MGGRYVLGSFRPTPFKRVPPTGRVWLGSEFGIAFWFASVPVVPSSVVDRHMTDDQVPPSDLALPATISAAALRWLLNLSNARLEQLVTAGIVTRFGRGLYTITSVRAVVEEQRRVRALGSSEFQRQRTELTRERALAARTARLEQEGRLLPRDLVDAAVCATFKTVRDRLLQVSTRSAPQAHGAASVPAAQSVIDQCVREALEGIAESGAPEVLARIEQAARQHGRRRAS